MFESLKRSLATRLVRSLNMDNYSWMTLGGAGGSASGRGALRPAEHATMVYGCLMARTGAIASAPIRISDAGGNLVESGPAFRLLERPNSQQSWDQYIRQLETNLTLYDCAAILPVGEPADELIALNPAGLKAVAGIHADAGTPTVHEWHYIDPSTGVQKIFAPDQLIVHQGFNPHAPLSPLSPLTVLKRTIEADLSARDLNLSLFKNDATPPLVLSTTGIMSKQQADEVRDSWNAIHRGAANRNKVGVLWGGLKAEKIGLSPAEMEYLAGLKFLRNDYYIAFRVRPAMVADLTGETGLSQGSGGKSQKVEWWEDVGLSELSLIASLHQPIVRALSGRGLVRRAPMSAGQTWALRRHLARANLAGGADTYVWFDDNVIPALIEHRLGKLEQFGKMLMAGYEPDAVAAWLDLGLPPHPTNVATIPMGVIPAADYARGRPEAAAERAAPAVDLDSAFNRLGEVIARASEPLPEPPAAPELTGRQRSLRRAFDAVAQRAEKAAARRWSRFFIEQRGRVLERAKGLAVARSDGELVRANVTDLLAQLFPLDEETEALLRRLTPLWVEHMQDGWNLTARQVGAAAGAMPFRMEDPRIQEALKARSIQGAKVNNTTEKDLRTILEQGIEEGLSPAQIGDRVASYYDNQIGETSARPQTAARTQVAGIVNDGQMAAARSAGNLRKSWMHGGSAEPREGHLRAAFVYSANPIPLDEKFEVNGNLCDAPGDAALPVEEVANCSCMVIFEPMG